MAVCPAGHVGFRFQGAQEWKHPSLEKWLLPACVLSLASHPHRIGFGHS